MKKVTFVDIYKKIRGPGTRPTVIIKSKKVYNRKDKSNDKSKRTKQDCTEMQDMLVSDS